MDRRSAVTIQPGSMLPDCEWRLQGGEQIQTSHFRHRKNLIIILPAVEYHTQIDGWYQTLLQSESEFKDNNVLVLLDVSVTDHQPNSVYLSSSRWLLSGEQGCLQQNPDESSVILVDRFGEVTKTWQVSEKNIPEVVDQLIVELMYIEHLCPE